MITSSDQMIINLAAQRLKKQLPVSRVILFGSKAKRADHAESDIDLLVLTSTPITPSLRAAISGCLADINLQHDTALSSVAVYEQEWEHGIARYTLLHDEVQRDGIEIL